MSWSCWEDIATDSTICLLICTNLDACGSLPREVFSRVSKFLAWLNHILYLSLDLINERDYLLILLLNNLGEFSDDMSHFNYFFLFYKCSISCHHQHSYWEGRSKRVKIVGGVIPIWPPSLWSKVWADVRVDIDDRLEGLITKVLYCWKAVFLTMRTLALFP